MKIKEHYVGAAALSLIFLFLMTVAVVSLTEELNKERANIHDTQTEYVYVYETEADEITESLQIEKWTVKEYNGKIAVFDSNGILTETIDTYIKTLPKADRELLREGIEVESKKELYDIIEAYTD